MTKLNYRLNLLRVTANPSYREATSEELRTLIALIECDGKCDDIETLSEMAHVSTARCRSAIVLWEEAGVIREDDGTPSIVDEFEERLVRGEIDEEPAIKVAESIRNEGLSSMLNECASLMGLACFSNTEVKKLTALCTQYALAPDYIMTLVAHRATKGHTTVRLICDEAIKLSGMGITTTELLDDYLKRMEESSGAEWEIRRALGIYNKSLSPSQKAYFKKWSEEYGYSVAIITEAYDISALNTGKCDLRYMDRILSDWHEAGCRTINECKARAEAKKTTVAQGTAKKKKSQPETPRYGNFDAKDAFMKALERSYGKENDDEERGV